MTSLIERRAGQHPSTGRDRAGRVGAVEMDALESRTLMSGSSHAHAGPPDDAQVYKPHATVRGETLQEWTADWWKWFWSIKASVNPMFDKTGAQSFRGDVGKVFFLTGMSETGSVERTVTIPTGTPVFFPLINTEWDNAGVPPLNYTVAQLRKFASDNTEATTDLFATLDGKAIGGDLFAHREKSPVFSYTLPDTDNVYQAGGLDITGTISPAVSDGYWLMLKPLKPGHHVLNFGGATSSGFALDITYDINVVPAGRANHEKHGHDDGEDDVVCGPSKGGNHDDKGGKRGNGVFSDRAVRVWD